MKGLILFVPLMIGRIWTNAVADQRAVRFNLRLLITLTVLCSVPEIVHGLALYGQSTAGGRWFWGYVALLGGVELVGALALASRRVVGGWLIVGAAVGFYLEAALGLAGFDRTVVTAVIYAVCIPAEAWVIWFLTHKRVQEHLAGWRRGPERSPAPRAAQPHGQEGGAPT